MNVFKKRPLSLILCIMLAAFSLFLDLGTLWVLVAIGLAILTFILSFIFKEFFTRGNLTRVCAVAFIIAVVLSKVFVWFNNPAVIYDQSYEIEGIVSDIDNTDGSSSSFTLTTSRVGNNNIQTKLYVTTDKEEIAGISNGDNVRFTATVERFKTSTSGFNEKAYYEARGFNGRIYSTEGLTLIEANAKNTVSIFETVQKHLANILRLSTDERTGGFLAALIMGDQSTLDDNIALNFRLIGISHILALSGMHLVIICGGVHFILSRLRINKKIIVAISTLFALFYMAITGFSAPVVRSAVMLAITNVLYLLMSTHDSYTTLPLSIVIILIFQPYAVYDISLWLSAFATLGILVFSDWSRRRPKAKESNIFLIILNAMADGLLATVFAIGASYIIMLCCFDTTSLIAPLTTLIFSLPINIMIYMGFVLILVYPFIPIGPVVVWYTDIVLWAAEMAARIDFAILCTDYLVVEALIIIFSVYIFWFIIVKLKRLTAAIVVLLILFSSTTLSALAFTQATRYKDDRYLVAVSRSDTVFIKEGGTSTIINTGNCSDDVAYRHISMLSDEKVMTLDNLVLTTYSYNSVSYVKEIIRKVKTDTLYIPAPLSAYELSIAEALSDELSAFGTALDIYDKERIINFSGIGYMLTARTNCTSEHISDSIFFLMIEGERYTYMSNGAPSKLRFYSTAIAMESDYIIFGTYGSGYSLDEYINFYSERLKAVWYANYLPFSSNTKEYYYEKEVPIVKIGTSNFIH